MLIKRRYFIVIAGAALIYPTTVQAQETVQGARLGVLMGQSETDLDAPPRIAALLQGLAEEGLFPGRNLTLDLRWTNGEPERAKAFANELFDLDPDVVIGFTSSATVALAARFETTPIIFTNVTDPISAGFVTNFARPDRNITGFTHFELTLGGKWLGLLKEAVPSMTRAMLLFNPTQPAGGARVFLPSFQTAADALGVEAIPVAITSVAEMEAAIERLGSESNGGLVAPADGFLLNSRAALLAAAARYRVPAIYPATFYTVEGGLISYGVDTTEIMRRAAAYVARILDGATPQDLPVQAAARYELWVNIKTATELGITFPPAFLALAHRIIE